MPKLHVVSDYQPSGDQPEAIDALAAGLEAGIEEQVLLVSFFHLNLAYM